MTAAAPQPLLDLQRLVMAVRRRRRSWLAAGLLGMLVGTLLAVLLPAPPTAVTRLLIVHEDEQGATSGSLMRTDIALLQTTRIAAAALKTLGSDEPPEDFVKEYKGTGLTNNVLELTVSGSDDRDAVARAKAVADAFIADHVQRVQAGADANAQVLLRQRDQAQAQLDEVDASIAAATAPGNRRDATVDPAELDALYARRAELASQIGELGRRAEEAGVGAPRVAAGTQIVDAPRALPHSAARSAVIGAGLGGVLGTAVGLMLAILGGVVRDRPVLRREISEHLGASVIAQLPSPRRGLSRLWWRSRHAEQRRRIAATLVRATRGERSVSLLDLGGTRATAALAADMATALAADGPLVVIDDLPGRQLTGLLAKRPDDPSGSDRVIRVVDGADVTGAPEASGVAGGRERLLGVGSVEPGTAWTDLSRLGAETVLVARAGRASTLWLHTVARQLADLRIPIIGVVLADPDPRDRSDGTLWDGLHTALRGRTGTGASPDTGADTGTRADTGAGRRAGPDPDDYPTQRLSPIRATPAPGATNGAHPAAEPRRPAWPTAEHDPTQHEVPLFARRRFED